MQGGAYPGMGALDSMGMQSVCDNVYDIPAFSAEFTLLKCNLPPRQAVRYATWTRSTLTGTRWPTAPPTSIACLT